MRLIFLPILIVSVLSANGQALWRNFFSTNQNPRVTAVAGSNVTVQASTVGSDQRIFTINSVPPTNVAYSGFATNANFATNAANATNFWGILNPTNIPSLAYISDNVGNGTNVTLRGVVTNYGGIQSTGIVSRIQSGSVDTLVTTNGRVAVNKNNPTTALDVNGTVLGSILQSANSVVAANAGAFYFVNRSGLYSDADGDFRIVNNADTSFSRLFFGKLNSSWPALKVESTNAPTLSVRNGADNQYASLLASNVISSGAHIATNGVQSYSSNNVVEVDGLGTAIVPALTLTNGTGAALGAQQYSPALSLVGGAWDTTFSTNTPVSIFQYVVPAQGDQFNKKGTWTVSGKVGGSFAPILQIRTDGPIATAGGISIPNGNTFNWSSRSQIASPADQDIQLVSLAGTAFSRLFFGPLNSSWPALKVETTNAPTLSVRTGADGNYASLMASNVTATGTVLATNIVANGTGTNIFAETLVTNNIVATNFALITPQWKDLIGTFVTAGASAPSAIAISNDYAIKVPGYQQGDDSHWQVQMPHNIAVTNSLFVRGTNAGQWHVEPHVHFSPIGATIDATHSNVTWGLEWVVYKLAGDIIAAGTNTVTTGVTVNGRHYYAEFGPITNAAPYGISDIMAFRLYRVASGVRDLSPNPATRDVGLLGFDVHAPVGNVTGLGSREETSQ